MGSPSIGAEQQLTHDPRQRTLHLVPPSAPGGNMMERFRCDSCGEVIGVYEPLVVCDRDHTRTTSRAAEPKLRASESSHYHRNCYAGGARGNPQATWP